MKEHALRPLLIGLGTFLVFLYGYITPYNEVAYFPIGDIHYLSGAVIAPLLTPEAFYLGAIMALGVIIGSMVTDIDAVEDDRRGGVRTVFTLLGEEKGTYAVCLLVFIAALTPLILFHQAIDVVLFVMLGVVASFLLYRKRNARPVLLIALLGLVYAAFRLIVQ